MTAGLVKVLSIDGAGMRGLIPARVLEYLETELNKKRGGFAPLHQVFDLIAGTSSGAVLAIGLTAPRSPGGDEAVFKPSDLVEFYYEHGDELFPPAGLRAMRPLTEARYSARPWERFLRTRFGDRTMRQALTNLLVVTYDIEERQPWFFKKRDRGKAARYVPDQPDPDFALWKVARAASATPTYFDPVLLRAEPGREGVQPGREYALIDGGLFAHNPSLCAFAEARKVFPSGSDILLVSLGSGIASRRFPIDTVCAWGGSGWIDPSAGMPMLSCAMAGQSDAVNHQLSLLLPEDRYFRFDARLTLASDEIDDATDVNLHRLDQHADAILEEQTNNGRLDQLIDLLAS